MIGIVNYGVGNIKAFANIYKNLNLDYKIVGRAEDLYNVTKIILPGVGSFDYAMNCLQKSGMRNDLDNLVLDKKIPVLGVCVGLQMFAKSSEEGKLQGLGWIDGVVKKIDNNKLNDMPLPHMGWNNLEIMKDNAIVTNIDNDSKLYFLHSYFIDCADNSVVTTTKYGDSFTSIINYENIYGIQPHPEKSHGTGIQILKNFGKLC